MQGMIPRGYICPLSSDGRVAAFMFYVLQFLLIFAHDTLDVHGSRTALRRFRNSLSLATFGLHVRR
jgi:hypothetical protein